jgi:hypothetical protein
MRATELGRDPISGYITADPNWWKQQNDVSVYCMIVIFFKSVGTTLTIMLSFFQAMLGCISF